MTSLSEYSKFDHLDDNDSDEGDHSNTVAAALSSASSSNGTPSTNTSTNNTNKNYTTNNNDHNDHDDNNTTRVTRKNPLTGRYVFEYGGRVVYEWEQSLEEVNVYVKVPPHVTSASQLVCHLRPRRLQLGLRGADRLFLDEDTFSKINTGHSSWYLDPDEQTVHIVLAKVYKGETWESVLSGGTHHSSNDHSSGTMDPMTKQEVQKEMMLERFQEENPGFDFRGADFNGAPPDPRTFMGGVRYT